MLSSVLCVNVLQITYWQRSLLLTGDVVTLLGETQRLWSYLEPLFLLSDEVKRELPKDAEVFATVDVRIRQLTAEFVRTSRVLQCATQDGVLVSVELDFGSALGARPCHVRVVKAQGTLTSHRGWGCGAVSVGAHRGCERRPRAVQKEPGRLPGRQAAVVSPVLLCVRCVK